MKKINIYTDGACSGNQNEENIGGWGYVLEYKGAEKEGCGGEFNTTNNRMELTALISALSALKEKNLAIDVFSDSSYLVNCFKNRWFESWQKNGWKTASKKPVENKDLWEKLLALLSDYECRFFLVKGHVSRPNSEDYKKFVANNGSEFSFEEYALITDFNNRCDALANVFINNAGPSA